MAGLFRFMIVEHPPEGESRTARLCIHGLIHSCHWEMLDATHVLVAAHYPAMNHAQLDGHSKCLVLPAHGLPKKITDHAAVRDKHHFVQHLKGLGHQDNWTTADLVEAATTRHGAKFEVPF